MQTSNGSSNTSSYLTPEQELNTIPTNSEPSAEGNRSFAGPPIQLAQQSCADFIATNCKAGILRKFPGEDLDQPLSKFHEDAANGNAAVRKAKKLLQQDQLESSGA